MFFCEIFLKRLGRSSFVLMLVLLSPVLRADDQAYEQLEKVSLAFRKVAEKVKPCVVSIETKYRSGDKSPQALYDYFDSKPQVQQGEGTGLVYSKNGIIVTNHHVIDGADEIRVIFNNGHEYLAKLKGQDPKTDLAVLEIEATDLQVAELGDSDKIFVGDWAIAIGNAMGFSQTVTVGIISAKGRSGLRDSRDEAYEDFIQTDAAVNRGNSGGPLCNIRGQIIGINAMIASLSGGSQGLAFTIPINMVKVVVEQLISAGKVQRGFLGVVINDLTEPLARQLKLKFEQGAVVEQVKAGSPAEMGGLKEGDIIVKINQHDIANGKDLRIRVSQLLPGQKVPVTFYRDGQQQVKTVAVGSLESEEAPVDHLGLKVKAASPADYKKNGAENGVLIEAVLPESPAARAGLEPGLLIISVDKARVNSVKEFETLFTESLAKGDKAVLLYVKSLDSGLYIVLEGN